MPKLTLPHGEKATSAPEPLPTLWLPTLVA